MEVPPSFPANAGGPTPLERVLLVLLGLAMGVVSLWLTGAMAFMASGPFDCSGPHDTTAVVGITIFGAIAVAIASLPWLLTVSVLGVGIGFRWLNRRWWIAVPLALALISAPAWAVAATKTPPPSETCQPFSMG